MKSIVVFWAVPALALVAVLLWAAWNRRVKRDPNMRDTLAGYERFREMLVRACAPVGQPPHGTDTAAGELPDNLGTPDVEPGPTAPGHRPVP